MLSDDDSNDAGFSQTSSYHGNTVQEDRPYALTSSSGYLSGKTVTKQSKRTDLYARRTGLANEQSSFDL